MYVQGPVKNTDLKVIFDVEFKWLKFYFLFLFIRLFVGFLDVSPIYHSLFSGIF